jgi:hypothetical protein
MKTAWQGRMLQAAARYSEAAPTATACCNACRTCATTNLATLAVGATAAAGAGLARFARRHAFSRSSAGKAVASAL